MFVSGLPRVYSFFLNTHTIILSWYTQQPTTSQTGERKRERKKETGSLCTRLTSTVGLPRESKISRALTLEIFAMSNFVLWWWIDDCGDADDDDEWVKADDSPEKRERERMYRWGGTRDYGNRHYSVMPTAWCTIINHSLRRQSKTRNRHLLVNGRVTLTV